jgi:hypothetical protein
VARILFTVNLQRHVQCESIDTAGKTVGEALAQAFARFPNLRGYVVDEHGAIRKHMNVFIDGTQISDRVGLSDPIDAASEIYIMQALSGG